MASSNIAHWAKSKYFGKRKPDELTDSRKKELQEEGDHSTAC